MINVFEAIRYATEPSPDGRTAATRPSAKEVLERLSEKGFVVVPRDRLTYTFEAIDLYVPAEPIGGIEQYQAEDR